MILNAVIALILRFFHRIRLLCWPITSQWLTIDLYCPLILSCSSSLPLLAITNRPCNTSECLGFVGPVFIESFEHCQEAPQPHCVMHRLHVLRGVFVAEELHFSTLTVMLTAGEFLWINRLSAKRSVSRQLRQTTTRPASSVRTYSTLSCPPLCQRCLRCRHCARRPPSSSLYGDSVVVGG